MINYEFEPLFRKDSVDKQIYIFYSPTEAITNEEIDTQNFSLTESLCSESQLEFGCCESGKVEFTVGYGITPLEGKTLHILLSPNDEEPLELGYFKVVSDVPTADRRRRTITAYDTMSEILDTECVDWYDSLFPDLESEITYKELRDSFFQFIGVQQETTNLMLDSYTVNKTILTSSLSGKDIVSAICQANLVFGHINREGVFVYKKLEPIGEGLYPAEDLYPADDLFPQGTTDAEVGRNGTYISASFEDYFVEPIDKLVIRMEENDVGCVLGNGTNAYVIQNNFLLFGKSTEELEDMYGDSLAYLSSITFTPAQIEAKGNPCLEVGDSIQVNTKYAVIQTYILQRELKGVKALRDVYVADSPKLRDEQLNTTNHSLMMLMGKSNTLSRTIEETRLTIIDVAEGLENEIVQTAEEFDVQIQNIQDQLDGNTQYYERNGTPTLENYPYWDWCTNLQLGDGTPEHPHIILDEIYNEDGSTGGEGQKYYPHFVYTEQNRKDHMRALCVDLDNGNGYRFVLLNNEWVWNLIADSDFSILFNQISELRQTVDGLDLEVSNTELVVAGHTTQINNNTANISLQANQIALRVEKNHVISEINQSAEQVTISASKINFNGMASFNNRATISNTGYLTAIGATLSSGTGDQKRIRLKDGSLSLEDANGYYGIIMLDREMRFYDYNTDGRLVGKILATYSSEVGGSSLGFLANYGRQASAFLGYQDGDNTPVVVINAGYRRGGRMYNHGQATVGWCDAYAYAIRIPEIHFGSVPDISQSVGGMIGCSDDGNMNLRSDVTTNIWVNQNVMLSIQKSSATRTIGQLIGTWYGTLQSSSDRRLKKDIKLLNDDVIEAIGQVEIKQFVFNFDDDNRNTGKIEIGVIAQDIQEVVPDDYGIVSESPEGLAVNYTEFLVARNAYLEKRVDDLEKRIERLERLLKGE